MRGVPSPRVLIGPWSVGLAYGSQILVDRLFGQFLDCLHHVGLVGYPLVVGAVGVCKVSQILLLSKVLAILGRVSLVVALLSFSEGGFVQDLILEILNQSLCC